MSYYSEENESEIREDLVSDAFERLLQIMEEQKRNCGEMDFPDAFYEACSEFGLTEDEEQALKDEYDNMCNRM